jgi:hypothetical protein
MSGANIVLDTCIVSYLMRAASRQRPTCPTSRTSLW